MTKFIKKPVVIEATQWFKHGDHPDVKTFQPPHLPQRRTCKRCDLDLEKFHGNIETLEGVHIVCSGDWIITGVADEKYPCKPDIFEKTYEAVGRPTHYCSRCSFETVRGLKARAPCPKCNRLMKVIQYRDAIHK